MTPDRCTADLASHCWRLHEAVTLSLPDQAGRVEEAVSWVCVWCHQQGAAWGLLDMDQPIPGPVAWEARTRAQRAAGDEGYTAVWRQLEGAQRLARRLAKGALLGLLLALAPGVSEARCPVVHRSQAVLAAFQRLHPCPSTGRTRGACPGYIRDHIKAIACGGKDIVQNIQWQTIAAARAKDKWERKGCPPCHLDQEVRPR